MNGTALIVNISKNNTENLQQTYLIPLLHSSPALDDIIIGSEIRRYVSIRTFVSVIIYNYLFSSLFYAVLDKTTRRWMLVFS